MMWRLAFMFLVIGITMDIANWMFGVFEEDFGKSPQSGSHEQYERIDHIVLSNVSDRETLDGLFSSLFCDGDTFSSRHCQVTNLCYLPDEHRFVFLYSPEHSRFVGLSGVDELNPLLKLNPVADHNFFDLSLAPISPAWLVEQEAVHFYGDWLVLQAFKPDNLMHVLHDDLLPLFATMFQLCRGGDVLGCHGTSWRLAVHSDLRSLPSLTRPLYSAMVGQFPLMTDSVRKPFCFQRAHLGLKRDTLWYQYGFSRPQGPLNSHVQPEIIEDFAAFMRQQLRAHSTELITVYGTSTDIFDSRSRNDSKKDGENTEVEFPSSVLDQIDTFGGLSMVQNINPNRFLWSVPKVVVTSLSGEFILLLTRKDTRKILNEADLAYRLSAQLQMPVASVAVDKLGVATAVELASHAALLVAMHGSALALALFLPRGATVVEMFPYGLNPDLYQPYRQLCRLRGLRYLAWRNTDAAATFPPAEDAPPEHGGLSHLSASVRAHVRAVTEVPAVLCCSDPVFLYRVYQNTLVDSAAVAQLAEQAKRRYAAQPAEPAFYFPGPVRNLSVDVSSVAPELRRLQWSAPSDVPDSVKLRYRVWSRRGAYSHETQEFVTTQPNVEVETSCERADCDVEFWIRAETGARKGVMVYYQQP